MVQVGGHERALQCSSVLQQELLWRGSPGWEGHIADDAATLALTKCKALIIEQKPASYAYDCSVRAQHGQLSASIYVTPQLRTDILNRMAAIPA